MSVKQENNNPVVAVLGMGNDLLKDEGLGVHVIRCLKDRGDLSGLVRMVEGGTCPDAIDEVWDVERLIIIDAVQGDGEPGTIYRLSLDQIQAQKPSSIHELTVMHMLWEINILSIPPEVTVLGIEPKEIGWGLNLSPELQEKLPGIVAVVRREIEQALIAVAV